MIRFAQLDPRPTPEAKASNDAIFESSTVLGIEVTIPALAQRCSLGNIDHHDEMDYAAAAIDIACKWPLAGFPPLLPLPKNFTIAILKPDCDSVGAGAVIYHRFDNTVSGRDLSRLMPDRIDLISKTDRFQKGEIWHPQYFPTKKNPWPTSGSVESSSELAALQAMCGDHTVPLMVRVNFMENWLKGGDLFCLHETIPYQIRIETERQNLIAALESGQIHYRLDGRIAIVESIHRAATMVGYCLAPIVVAINPEFKFRPDMPPIRKITICTWSSRYADIPACLAELKQIESGWGGSGNIGGSPQGVDCQIKTQNIVEIIKRFAHNEISF